MVGRAPQPQPAKPAAAPPVSHQQGAPAAVSNNNGNGSANGHANGNNGSNGTNGNGATTKPFTPPAFPAPPTKVPIAQAVIDAVQMVQMAMKATGEQWSDNSRQDLASTVLITYQREGWLCLR